MPIADVPLAPLTTMGTGGSARWLWRWHSAADLRAGLEWARAHGLPWWLLGGGSNVLVADAGLPGVVLQAAASGWAVGAQTADSWSVDVAAGCRWDDVVAWSVHAGLGGLECLSGIPGVAGAAPIQNIGAYGQEVAEVIESVDVLDTSDGSTASWPASRCAFAYRDSVFKRHPGRWIVTSVRLRLSVAGRPCTRYAQVADAVAHTPLAVGAPGLQQVRDAVLALRRGKGMLVDATDPDSRSCGSFFVNPVVSAAEAERVRALFPARAMPAWPGSDGAVKLSAAWLIEQCGMRPGYGEGRVGLSSKHTLALVNRGDASTADVLAFAAHVVARVEAACGISLQREPVLLGF